MGPSIKTGSYVKYKTWYEFKKELEANVERPLVNDVWLQLKPRAPLPWDLSQMKVAQLKYQHLISKKIPR